MKVKEENKEKFVNAMQNLVRSLKDETESCSAACGGLNEKELLVVVYVGQHERVKMSDIADNISAPMSTLTSIVDKLVEKDFLAREHSSLDRRAIHVMLAGNGKTAYKYLSGKKKKIAEKILSHYNEKEQAVFIEHINLLASYLGTEK